MQARFQWAIVLERDTGRRCDAAIRCDSGHQRHFAESMIPEPANPLDLFNQVFWKVAGVLTGQLLHDLLDLTFQHRDRMMPSVLS